MQLPCAKLLTAPKPCARNVFFFQLRSLCQGAWPPIPTDAETGEWKHGWQYHATNARELDVLSTAVLLEGDPAGRVLLLLSQSGLSAGRWLTAILNGLGATTPRSGCRSRCGAGCDGLPRQCREMQWAVVPASFGHLRRPLGLVLSVGQIEAKVQTLGAHLGQGV